ncbi:hypothetical protein LWM68_21285 [Niabella sp. W65]|nr:hypothetical protein [Niabella sp. W65]MCH7365065.1 hypothetical protein [Niabella sp. W65]
MLKTCFFLLLPLVVLKSIAQDVSLDLQKAPKLTAGQLARQWNSLPADVMVSFASSGTRLVREAPPVVNPSLTWKATGWKNEQLHTQIVIAGKKTWRI